MVMPAWRNGRRSRLKIYRTQVCMSSSLIAGIFTFNNLCLEKGKYKANGYR